MNNRYDELYDFRIATVDDIDAIMLFIKNQWNENHVLAKSKELFVWQYGNQHYGDNVNINVVLMLDKVGNIVGMNGFIPYSYYVEQVDFYVSSALTKVKSDIPIPMSGVELIKRFRNLIPAKAYYSSGTNPKTIMPLGKKIFNYTVGEIQQFYLLNPKKSKFKIAQIAEKPSTKIYDVLSSLEQVYSFQELIQRFDLKQKYEKQAYKSKEYIEHRFFRHPVYDYEAYGIKANDEKDYKGILFGRKIEVEGEQIFRIADYLGNLQFIFELTGMLQQMMIQKNYEYIEFMVGTLDEVKMQEAGFVLHKGDKNIIPIYFEPFEQRNVTIYYQKSDENIVIFKADGDQDRPNYFR